MTDYRHATWKQHVLPKTKLRDEMSSGEGGTQPLLTAPGFKKSAKSGTTRPIHNRLWANRVDTVTRYETESVPVKTRWTRPNSGDDSVNLVQNGDNTENNLNNKETKFKK